MEKVFFEHGSVKLTNTRFINGTTTYPITGITSVVSGEKEPSYSNAVWMGVFGAFSLIGGLVPPTSWGWLVFGVILLILSYGIFKTKKIQYAIIFGTAGGDKDGLLTEDRAYRESVLKALNDAISYRE